ncbi:ABC transporter substrate-binding protein [Cetobacterium sp. ZWU0022]|uniref:ABC transporter substrate-binding protein n=1 Tax=Cetobacterium sp. ZWU0022 TaxID=1340502 RepID=UPI0006483D78|nr:ABC transporter substrate-binding protein [Cetobacterium sp. ZWU0022]
MKKYLKILGLASILFIAGCGDSEKKDTVSTENKKVELSFVTFTGTGEEYMMDINSLSEAYQKINPNVTIKMEKILATEYDNTMKIRNSAQKLPDIFPVRVVTMESFKSVLLPLNESEATKVNKFAKDFEIDGNVYGLPMYGFNEFIYYRKSIFNDLNLEIPTTWKEFVELSRKIKENGVYIPMALGAKDSWTTYPFNEFMPFLVPGGNDILSKMAVEKDPFSSGKPFYVAYDMLDKYYSMKPFGDDPLGYGWDQEKSMFAAKKSAMLAAGQWFYMDLEKEMTKETLDDIGVFVLPARETKDDPFRYLVSAEVFLSIPKYSKNKEEAKKFLDWFFKSDYYKEYVTYMNVLPAVNEVKGRESIFNTAIASIPNPEVVLQKGGDEKFRKIANYISFDVKRMGQEMIQGVNFSEYMDEYNKKWKEAQENIK